MKDSGKSRADLWAFAALVGLYKGIENNNKACDGKANAAVCGHREAFQDGCEVDFPRIPRFQTGRKDCIGNVQFFKFGSNFGSNLNHFFGYNLFFGSKLFFGSNIIIASKLLFGSNLVFPSNLIFA